MSKRVELLSQWRPTRVIFYFRCNCMRLAILSGRIHYFLYMCKIFSVISFALCQTFESMEVKARLGTPPRVGLVGTRLMLSRLDATFVVPFTRAQCCITFHLLSSIFHHEGRRQMGGGKTDSFIALPNFSLVIVHWGFSL